MALSIAAITFAQATEPATESAPEADTGEVDSALPPSGTASTDNGLTSQSDPSTEPVSSSTVEFENQRRLNEFQSEYLDDRADTLNRWLDFVAIVLTFFAVAVALAGFLGFRRFREIETEAKNSAKAASDHAKDAKSYTEETKSNRDKSENYFRGRTTKTDVNDPDTKQAVKDARENPEASLTDKAIADAVSLQQQGEVKDAIEKWRAVAVVAEGSDNDLAVRAWFSIGYLLQDKDPEGGVSAYNQTLRLKPDFAEAYTNRGSAKAALEQYADAVADYNEALKLKPNFAEAYTNRGSAKAALEQYADAITDYNEALKLEPDSAEAHYRNDKVKVTRRDQVKVTHPG